jgi:hypothetical protein
MQCKMPVAQSTVSGRKQSAERLDIFSSGDAIVAWCSPGEITTSAEVVASQNPHAPRISW